MTQAPAKLYFLYSHETKLTSLITIMKSAQKPSKYLTEEVYILTLCYKWMSSLLFLHLACTRSYRITTLVTYSMNVKVLMFL